MRYSNARLNVVRLEMGFAYEKPENRTVTAMAKALGVSRPLVYKLAKENPGTYKELLPRRKHTGRPRQLTDGQLATLFASTSEKTLFPLRNAAKELFGLDLQDTTVYKYIRMYEAGTLFAPRSSKPRARMVTDEQMQIIANKFRAGLPLTMPNVLEQLETVTGKENIARSTAYYYLRIMEKELQT